MRRACAVLIFFMGLFLMPGELSHPYAEAKEMASVPKEFTSPSAITETKVLDERKRTPEVGRERVQSAVVPSEMTSRSDLDYEISGISIQSLSKEERKRVRDKVKALRARKKEQFDELTRGFIRKILREEDVISKEEFLKRGPRNLDDCIRRAIQVHVPAKMAKERIKLAKLRIVKSLRDLLAEAVIELEDRRGSLSGQAFTGDSFRARFRQPVFRGGNLWHTFLKERVTLRAAEAERRKIVNDLIRDVSEAYFNTLKAAESLRGQEVLLKAADQALDVCKKKFDQGLISEIEYLNVQSQQSQVAHDVEQARQDVELEFLELQKNIAIDFNEKITLAPFYDYDKVMEDVEARDKRLKKGKGLSPLRETEFGKPLDRYVQMAYDNRPDIKQEVNRLRANIMAKRAAAGKLLPQLNVVMEFGDLAEAFTDTVDDPPHQPEWQAIVELTWNAGGSTAKYTLDHDENGPSVSQFQSGQGTETTKNSFSLAILDNLEDVYKLKEAQIDIMDQFIELEEKEREMIREVKEAYFNFRRAEVQLASQVRQLVYKEKLAKISKHKLELNEVQVSEYLQNEMDVTEEKGQFHKAMSDYYVALVGLNRAVGIRELLPVKEWD